MESFLYKKLNTTFSKVVTKYDLIKYIYYIDVITHYLLFNIDQTQLNETVIKKRK